MSYILDALRKSEQEREQEALPTLRTPPRRAPRHRWLRVVLPLGAVALVAVIAAVWVAGPGLLDARNASRAPAGVDDSAARPVTSPAAPRTAEVETPDPRNDATGAQPEARPSNQAVGAAGPDPATRRRVKGLSVNVVSYSDVPERRFAMIDQRIVRESEIVADGVVVERIVPDGVVLSVGAEEVLLRPQ